MRPWSVPLFAGLLALLGCPANVGCNTMQPNGFPREFGLAAQQVSTAISDQAVFERVLARLDGQIIEPGVEGYAGMLYIAGGRLRGVSGQLSIEGDGRGSGTLSPEARQKLLSLGITPDLLEQVLAYLREQKTSPPAPAPPSLSTPPEATAPIAPVSEAERRRLMAIVDALDDARERATAERAELERIRAAPQSQPAAPEGG